MDGTQHRLMGLVADINQVTSMLREQVLEVVRREAVLDADADVDFEVLSQEVLDLELQERVYTDDLLIERAQMVNEALGELSGVLMQISEQLCKTRGDR